MNWTPALLCHGRAGFMRTFLVAKVFDIALQYAASVYTLS